MNGGEERVGERRKGGEGDEASDGGKKRKTAVNVSLGQV